MKWTQKKLSFILWFQWIDGSRQKVINIYERYILIITFSARFCSQFPFKMNVMYYPVIISTGLLFFFLVRHFYSFSLFAEVECSFIYFCHLLSFCDSMMLDSTHEWRSPAQAFIFKYTSASGIWRFDHFRIWFYYFPFLIL